MKKLFSKIILAVAAIGFFTACSDVPEPYNIKTEEEEEGVYVSETFASDLGNFTVFTEEGYSWTQSYSSAYISGYQNQENKATKTWLISESFDLSNATSVYASFQYIYRYARSTTEEKVLVSANYDGEDPTTATWYELNVNLVEGSDWSTWSTAEVNLPAEVIGQSNVVIALYYMATTKEASTWEVKNLVVRDGTATEQEDKPTTVTGEPSGSGTAADPYNVAAALELINNGTYTSDKVYVKGKISSVKEISTSYGNATYYISDDGSASNQLTIYRGYDLNGAKFTSEDALAAGDSVVVYGQLTLYGSTPEMTQGNQLYYHNGQGGSDPDTPLAAGEYINEAFSSDFGVFSAYTETGNDWQIKYTTAYNSGYQNKTNTATKAWLIASPIDLSNVKEVCCTFDYIYRYARTSCKEQVLVTSNYTGDPTTTTWTALSITLTEGSDYTTFYNASANLPSSVIGKSNVVVAIYYEAPATEASTIEIKNFVVKDGSVEGGSSTGGEETTTLGTYDNPFTVAQAQAAYTAGTTGNTYVKAYIVGYVDGNAYETGATFAVPSEAQTEILLADNASETTATNCLPVQLPKGDIRDGLELYAHQSYLGQEVLLYGSLTSYFKVAGIKSTSYAEINGTTIGTKPE